MNLPLIFHYFCMKPTINYDANNPISVFKCCSLKYSNLFFFFLKKKITYMNITLSINIKINKKITLNKTLFALIIKGSYSFFRYNTPLNLWI